MRIDSVTFVPQCHFVHRYSVWTAGAPQAQHAKCVETLREATAHYGHVATTKQLLSHGYAPHDLTAAVRSGTLLRLRQGRYATADATAGQRLAVSVGGKLACVSAAATYGLWSGDDPRVHIAVSRNASRLMTVGSKGFCRPSTRSVGGVAPRRRYGHFRVLAYCG